MIEKTEVVKDPNGMWRLRLQVTNLTGEDSHLIKFPQGEEKDGDDYTFFYKENRDGFVSYGPFRKMTLIIMKPDTFGQAALVS